MGISKRILEEVKGTAVETVSDELKTYMSIFSRKFIDLIDQYKEAESKENVMVSMMAELEGMSGDLNSFGYVFEPNPIENADANQLETRLERFQEFLNDYTEPEKIEDNMIEVFNTNVKSMLKLIDTYKAQSVNEEAIIIEESAVENGSQPILK